MSRIHKVHVYFFTTQMTLWSTISSKSPMPRANFVPGSLGQVQPSSGPLWARFSLLQVLLQVLLFARLHGARVHQGSERHRGPAVLVEGHQGTGPPEVPGRWPSSPLLASFQPGGSRGANQVHFHRSLFGQLLCSAASASPYAVATIAPSADRFDKSICVVHQGL